MGAPRGEEGATNTLFAFGQFNQIGGGGGGGGGLLANSTRLGGGGGGGGAVCFWLIQPVWGCCQLSANSISGVSAFGRYSTNGGGCCPLSADSASGGVRKYVVCYLLLQGGGGGGHGPSPPSLGTPICMLF